MSTDFVRTPDQRFADLADFPYEPDYLDIDGLRMAYIDEGPTDGPLLLLLHGEPTWSYLYRRMIPPLVQAGFRCVAPDLIGFGRSDKPTDQSAYTYAGHLGWLQSFIAGAGLSEINLFAQDWGGLLGLRAVAADPERFTTVAIGNTALPTGESAGDGFDSWLAFSQSGAFNDVGGLLSRAVQARTLTEAEIAAYQAPFPSEEYLAGVIVFPRLVPITPAHPQVEENKAAWNVLEGWTEPFLTLWCPEDPVLGHFQQEFIDRIPGAAGQPHQSLRPGGHFIQDDRGEDVAAALIAWLSLD
ncbi:MAG: alpha/beta fold hydrolase [Acidimicrobiales bacterium]|nr:alpha/beta fold hydrolase [Acidimicrobiales bacterium]